MNGTGRGRRVVRMLVGTYADLSVTALLTLFIGVVLVGELIQPPIARLLVSLPLFLFLPGYAIVAGMFPERPTTPGNETGGAAGGSETRGRLVDQRLSSLERLVFSVGTSVVVVPIAGLLLNLSFTELSPVLVAVSLVAVTLIATAVAGVRRRRVPPRRRFQPLHVERVMSLLRPKSTVELAANLAIAVSLVLLLSSLAYAVGVPNETFTEFYLLSEDETGDLVASGYPETFVEGTGQPIYVGIENHEGRDASYTVVVTLEEVGTDGAVVSSNELDRLDVSVAAGDTRRIRHVVEPSMVGEDLRLSYRLYLGDPPAATTDESAYRRTHIWIDVTD